MSLKKDGIMVILSSPSGAGKTTLVKLLSENKNYKISISHTTRKPRSNEVNGKDYHFISDQEFENLVKKKEFLEHAKVFNNWYGTSEVQVIEYLKNRKNVVFDIDWQGTQQIMNKKLNYKLITFFVLPPSREVLLNRLYKREIKDKFIVEERMKQFNDDLLHWENYDYVVINDDLNKCFKEICLFLESEKKKEKNYYDRERIKKHIEDLLN